MAKTQPLPLRLGFQGEPNTPESCYQIVICLGVKSCVSVYTGAKFISLGERLPRMGFKMICSYCNNAVEILAYRLGEVMCLDCAKSAFYAILENGNQVLSVNKKAGA
jgi:hypothetical protein